MALVQTRRLIDELARTVYYDQHNAKFVACEKLTRVLEGVDIQYPDLRESLSAEDTKHGFHWSAAARAGLIEMLCGVKAVDERIKVLRCVSAIVSVMGPLWAFKRAPAGEKRGAVFFPLLIVELARVEISLLLEDLAGDKFVMSKQSSSTMLAIDGRERLAICLHLVESVIVGLGRLMDEMEDEVSTDPELLAVSEVDPSHFLSLQSALLDIMNGALNMLEDICLSQTNASASYLEQADALAAIRLLSVYAADDLESVKSRLAPLIPFMLRAVRSQLHHNGMDLLLPALPAMMEDRECSKTLLEHGIQQLCIEWLTNSWTTTKGNTKAVPSLNRFMERDCLMLLLNLAFDDNDTCLKKRAASQINSWLMKLTQSEA